MLREKLSKTSPMVLIGGALAVLIVGAVAIGSLRGGPPAADEASAGSPAPAPAPAPGNDDPASRPGPQPAPADAAPRAGRIASLRPAAFPLAEKLVPGVMVEVFNGGQEGDQWSRIARSSISEGMPMAVIDTAATYAENSRGWSRENLMRVTRTGLFRVDDAGEHSLLLSVERDAMARRADSNCSAAVGDPSSVVVRGSAEGAGTVQLAEGWHWLYFSCVTRRHSTAGEIAILSAQHEAPVVVALYQPAAAVEASDAEPVTERRDVEAEPEGADA